MQSHYVMPYSVVFGYMSNIFAVEYRFAALGTVIGLAKISPPKEIHIDFEYQRKPLGTLCGGETTGSNSLIVAY